VSRSCPACGATVQLDAEQLVYKRGTCGAVGLDFELVTELFGRTQRVEAQALAVVDRRCRRWSVSATMATSCSDQR